MSHGEPLLDRAAIEDAFRAERGEEAWLNQLADEAEAEGRERSVSLEAMAAMVRG